MVTISEVKEECNDVIREHTDNPVDVLKEMAKESEGLRKSVITLVLKNLGSEIEYFDYRAAQKVINENKREALEEADSLFDEGNNLVDERNNLVEKISKEVGDNDITAGSALYVAKAAGLDELAEKLEKVESKMDEIREPFNKLAKEPANKKNDSKARMIGTVESLFGRSAEVPDGIKTYPE